METLTHRILSTADAKRALCSTEDVAIRAEMARNAFGIYRANYQRYEMALDPEGAKNALSREIEAEDDMQKAVVAAHELSTLSDPKAADALRESAKVSVRELHAELRPYVVDLVDAARREWETILNSAREAEAEFLASHGCEWEPTAVSRRLATVTAALEHFDKALKERSDFIFSAPQRNAFKELIEWFTVAPEAPQPAPIPKRGFKLGSLFKH